MSRTVETPSGIEIQYEDPFLYGEMLLRRMPKDRAECEQLMQQHAQLTAADEARQQRGEVEYRERICREAAEALRVSNTQLPNSNSSLVSCLESDQKLFESVPTGGGGIDWLNVSVCHGEIGEAGWRIRDLFLAERDGARERGEKKSIVFLEGVEHPFIVHHQAVGQGATKQPLMVHWNGLTIRYGKFQESYPKSGGYLGTLAVIECPGLTCLRLGESGMCRQMMLLCQLLGIQVKGCRATRLDACADLIECDINHFGRAYQQGNCVTRASDVDVHYVKGKCTGITARTKAITLNVYDKLTEVVNSGDQEKLALMIANRWGHMPESAVRVEYQFTLSHLSAMKFNSLEELFEGMGRLLEWACNDWFRLAEVNSRSNTSRSRLLASWLRVCHAFSWWAGRFNMRPETKPVTPAAPYRMCRQTRGLIASILVRLGYRVDRENRRGKFRGKGGKTAIVDDGTGYDILIQYLQSCRDSEDDSLVNAIMKLGAEWDAKRGTNEPDWIMCPQCGVIIKDPPAGACTCHACGATC